MRAFYTIVVIVYAVATIARDLREGDKVLALVTAVTFAIVSVIGWRLLTP